MSRRTLLWAALLAALSFGRVATSDLSCQLEAPGKYRIGFSKPVGKIYASHSPDSIDEDAPVITAARSPVEFDLPNFEGRPYFHLKPPSGPERVVSIRRLPLEGQENFRDLGGYPTFDGGSIKWGKLYRSGQLSAVSDKDLAYLNSIGVKLVCDLRSLSEGTAQPTRWTNGPEVIEQPIGDDPEGKALNRGKFDKVFKYGASAPAVRGVMMGIYADIVPRATPRYKVLFHRLLAGDTPAMFHCTSGKDRTGLFAAFLLQTLGVPRSVIMQDYLLTNQYVLAPEVVERAALSVKKQYDLPALPPIESIKPMVGVEAVYLESVWRFINSHYAGFDNYRRQQLDITDADVKHLREMYVSHP